MEDYMLLHNRAKLVKKYRESKSLWPDGIDHSGNRWYGDGKDWPQEKVELMSSVKWLEDRLMERGSERTPVTLYGLMRVTKSVTPKNVTQPVTVTMIEPTAEERKRIQTKARVARLRAKQRLEAANPKREGK
jgi:hypothetical protein